MKLWITFLALAFVASSTQLLAQENPAPETPAPEAEQQAPEFPKPTKEHEWLKKFAGEWTSKTKCVMGLGQEPIEGTATISCKMLGGFWVVSTMDSEMMGDKFTAIQTIGYDPAKEKYVGTWVDSMFSHMWKYEGSVDETGKILTLEAEGPNFMTGEGNALFRDIYEFKSEDTVVATSQMKGEDGKWITFVNGVSKRK